MDQIQVIQNKHRQALIDYWNIPESSNVLEIGCGQGDTTALLARAVGKNGFVYAIDPAPGSYGAPITLEQARLKLLSSAIGERIRMDFDTDIFSPKLENNEKMFDYVVFSHCSWYFTSADLLYRTLLKAHQYTRKLCFAEWDIRISSLKQFAHYQAIMLQAQCNSYQELSNSNIKTLFTPYDIVDIIKKAGWNMMKNTVIDSSYLQDGEWEINTVLEEYPSIIREMNNLSQKTKELLLSNIQLIENMSTENKQDSLNTFAFIAQ